MHLAPVFAEMARRHPLLHVQASYSDRFVDIVGEGFDCAIRVGYLSDFQLDRASRRACAWKTSSQARTISGRMGHPRRRMSCLPIRRSCREPKPGNLSMAARTISIHPQGRFKADNGTALAAAAAAGTGIAWLPDHLIKGFLDTGSLVPSDDALSRPDGWHVRCPASRSAPHTESPGSYRIAD